MTKQELLTTIDLGDRVAENEWQKLPSYFLETIEWKRLISDEIDIIKGQKGSGKSALYISLGNSKNKLIEKGIIICEAENPSGTSAFSKMLEDNNISDNEFRDIWKMYIISLLFNRLAEEINLFQRIFNRKYKKLKRCLINGKIISRGEGLHGIFNRAYDYILNKEVYSSETGLSIDPITMMPIISRKVEKREDTENIKLKYITLDKIVEEINEILKSINKKAWIVFDRLDVLLESNSELQLRIVKTLFRAYSDIRMISNIKLKLFIRDDIWKNITEKGFIEASHLTRETKIEWDDNRILNLIVSRFINNEDICTYYKIEKSELLVDFQKQKELFYRIFPKKVEAGSRKSSTFDWMLNRVTDGNGVYTPREMIHFVQELRNEEMQKLIRGEDNSSGENLFGTNIFKDAYKNVSKEKFEKVLLSEYPDLREYFLKFEGHHTEYSKEKIRELFQIENIDEVITKLCSVGFLQYIKASEMYKIPFIYQPCLDIILGKE